MAAKATVPGEAFACVDRFRGHGPLLQNRHPLPRLVAHQRGIYKGASPCWYALRPSRRGPAAREAAMAPKAVDARTRFTRDSRFRGHGPLLQNQHPLPRLVAHQRGIYKGASPCWYALRPSRRGPAAREAAMAPKAVDARTRFTRDSRFRGHGPLLQNQHPLPRLVAHQRGIYKGASPCWYALRPSRRGPAAREAAMACSYRFTAQNGVQEAPDPPAPQCRTVRRRGAPMSRPGIALYSRALRHDKRLPP